MIMNKKVLFVANNANGGPVIDGQRAKTRVWLDIFKMENIPFEFVELDGWKKHPFKLISQIKKGIKNNDVILLMAASNGSRTLIPLINKWNKKYDKRFVYSFIGSGPLSNIINKMNADEANDFVLRHNFHNVSDFKFGKEIQKVDCLLTETKIMKDLVNAFYRTKNAIVINNFRNQSRNNLDNAKNSSNVLKCVYISRICKNKGIFDLLGAIENAKNIALDIYGPLQLDNDELKIFNTYLKKNVNTCYCGKIEMPSIVPTIKRYDLVVFGQDMKPQIVIECKAPHVELTQKVIAQAGRYNKTLRAPILGVTNGSAHFFFTIDFETEEIQPLTDF